MRPTEGLDAFAMLTLQFFDFELDGSMQLDHFQRYEQVSPLRLWVMTYLP